MRHIEDYNHIKEEMYFLLGSFVIQFFIFLPLIVVFGTFYSSFTLALANILVIYGIFLVTRFPFFISELKVLERVKKGEIEYEIIIKKRNKRLKIDIIFIIIFFIIYILFVTWLMSYELSLFESVFNLASFMILIQGNSFFYDIIITKWRLKKFGQSKKTE